MMLRHEKTHSLEHEHILSGILKCPICGASMYGTVNRKKKKDGSGYYRDGWYYVCKVRLVGMFVNSPLWIVYNVIVGSWAGILDEAVSEISMIVSIIRYGWKNLDSESHDGREAA